jgi:alkylation response protein AidB-like acyl-CoA dehydrogenase
VGFGNHISLAQQLHELAQRVAVMRRALRQGYPVAETPDLRDALAQAVAMIRAAGLPDTLPLSLPDAAEVIDMLDLCAQWAEAGERADCDDRRRVLDLAHLVWSRGAFLHGAEAAEEGAA